MNAIRRMLTNPNAQAQGLGAGTSRVRSGGGLAGVASKAQGQTIKVVNDQLDYALWEFYYDPSKDVKQVTPGGTGLGGAQGAGANTFNRAVTNPNPQTPINPPPPSPAPAPAVAPAEPPQFEPNPNPSSEIPPPDEPPNPDNPNPDNPNPDNPNPDNPNPDNNNPDNNNPNDTPAEPPQLRL
jgi:membrane peptidoglycan carboxypeptidase